MSLSNADPEAPFRPGAAAPWPSWAGRLRGRPALRAAGVLFTAGVAGWVIHQITEAGWRQVADSLPATPWFYLIFAGMYLAPPLSEVFVFRRLWGPVPGLWPAMLMRRLPMCRMAAMQEPTAVMDSTPLASSMSFAIDRS